MRLPALLIAALLVGFSSASAEERVDYLGTIKPLLEARCYACHGALKQEAGLRLDTAELIQHGSESGPVVEAGDAAASVLVAMLTGELGTRMPPEGMPLSDEEIELFRRWIAQGAQGAAEETPEADPRDHWAFRRPLRPAVPEVTDPAWMRNPIDAFIADSREKRGLVPISAAEKPVLLRRVYLDLIGLPPPREDLHAFLEDASPDAYEKVVDRLLNSPQYGERWGRHWMDVWRYSDWYGRRGQGDVRNSYPHIWRWRDWIVRSLNEDKGYDRMVIEMLAADEIASDDPETVVATGFLARNWYKLNYNIWMKNLVEHTGKAFLGLTLNCALCHDHKYDPVSQQEYFQFRAFFEPLELRQDRVPGLPDPGAFQKYVYGSSLKPIEAGLVRVFDEKPDAETYLLVLGDERKRQEGVPPVPPVPPAALGLEHFALEPVDLPPAAFYPALDERIQREEIDTHEKSLASAKHALSASVQALSTAIEALASANAAASSRNPADESPSLSESTQQALEGLHKAEFAVRLAEAKRLTASAELESVLARIEADNAKYKDASGDIAALSARAAKAERQAALAEARQNLFKAEQDLSDTKKKDTEDPAGKKSEIEKAEQTVKDARAAVAEAQKASENGGSEYTPLGPVYPKHSTGRRSALARWIASRNNPLTARVAVNHMWMRHFGAPLVETVFDFGRNGKAPSHPELLDWLAVEFMDHGWSMKYLHRLMVMSNTYRSKSGGGEQSESMAAVDPENRYYWRMNPRRMEAEVIRDSVLFAAGSLDQTFAGPEIDQTQGQSSHRRSLYFSHHEEGQMKLMEIFDVAGPAECYRRTETVVPQQALAMTNSQLISDQSRVLARRLWQDLDPEQCGAEEAEASFIVAAFEQVISRAPTTEEHTTCEAFLQKQRELYQSTQLEPPATENDAKVGAPASDPALRARESLLRALLNHNDFVTVR